MKNFIETALNGKRMSIQILHITSICDCELRGISRAEIHTPSETVRVDDDYDTIMEKIKAATSLTIGNRGSRKG
jgi:hypothetical protein